MKPSPSTRAESKRARSSNWRVPVFGRGIWRKCATTDLDDARAGWQPMVLVDTSVWIEVFRKPARAPMESYLDLEEAVTCLPVIQEVLQGFRDQRAFQIAREAMHALPIVESPLRSAVYERAIDLYRLARRQGLTIRSGVDCLIAACALRARFARGAPGPRFFTARTGISRSKPSTSPASRRISAIRISADSCTIRGTGYTTPEFTASQVLFGGMEFGSCVACPRIDGGPSA